MWLVIWKGEVVDEFDTETEARAMADEYAMAFGSPTTVVYKETT